MKIALRLILMFVILALIGGSIVVTAEYIIEKQEFVERVDALVLLGITTIVLIAIVGFSFSKNIIKDITKLRDAADKISKGNLTEPIKIKSKDEIGELAESFDNMRYSLKMVIDEYEKMKGNEELVKKLEKTKDELEISEIRYKTIFEEARDGILATDAKTKKFLFVNPQMCKITGYSEKELTKLSVSDIHPKKDLPYVIDQFTKQVKGKVALARDIPVLRKDKKIVYCDVNSSPINVGEQSMLLGFFREVIKKKK